MQTSRVQRKEASKVTVVSQRLTNYLLNMTKGLRAALVSF